MIRGFGRQAELLRDPAGGGVKFGLKQLAILLLALVFLFETWVWGSMVAAARAVAAFIPWTHFQIWARGVINGLPVIVAVLLFGVPLFVSEFGAFISVVLMATGHLLIGSTMYVALKIVGVSLIPVIFDITREKLMTLPWFVFLYEQFERLHAMATRFVAPYRVAALGLLRRARDAARTVWARFYAETEDAS
jgi:hypothetical protein